MQWLYEAFYSAIGELFADINDLGVEIFDLSWVQAVVSLFTMLGWSLFVVGVVVAVFEVAIESQSGRVNIKGTALNVLKGFFGASLVGVLPVQLYKTCCTLQGIFTADLAGIYAGSQSSTIGAFAGQVLRLAFVPSEAVEVGLKLTPSTNLEGCTGMVLGQRLIWKNPSGGMPKHTRDFLPWKRLWQTISSAIALAP